MRKIAKVLAVIAALVMAAGAAGCSKKDAASSQGGKVKLRYYNIWPLVDSQPVSKVYYAMYDEFRAQHPEIDLEVISDAHEAWSTKIKIMMSANDLTEIFISQPKDFIVYADSGVYYDFTDDLNADPEWKNSFMPGSLDIMAKNGRVYGIPHTGYAAGVFYNKAIFDRFNLSFPQTYDSLLSCIKTFTAGGIDPFVVGGKEAWPITFYTQYWLDREAGYQYFEDAASDKSKTFENPLYETAMTKFLDAVKMGAFSKGSSGASSDDARSYFMQGKAAMLITGSWDIGSYTADPEFSKVVHFANFPAIPGGKGVQNAACVGFGKSFCISNAASAGQKKAALEFVKFMNNSAASGRLMNEAGEIVAQKPTGVDMTKVAPLLQELNAVTGAADQVWAGYGEFTTPGFYDELNKIGQQMLLGAVNAKEALVLMEKARLEFQFEL
jgi:raffinose/stachyose/melibiose transport system substrate-binding protein